MPLVPWRLWPGDGVALMGWCEGWAVLKPLTPGRRHSLHSHLSSSEHNRHRSLPHVMSPCALKQASKGCYHRRCVSHLLPLCHVSAAAAAAHTCTHTGTSAAVTLHRIHCPTRSVFHLLFNTQAHREAARSGASAT